MKILEIYIYGYGKLENVKLTNNGGLNVFYGVNETGKSTIMSFIHSILFGFPTKQQSELRYEPKKGAKYGGQLVVDFPSIGRAVIERVKGKAVGDVSVLLQDGTRGGEDLLKELLAVVDKTLFQSIFSFNLQGLQNVNQLKSEDLGRFLFSAGTLGSDRLFTVDSYLNKELELLFKPNGKKPYLNEKLEELREVHTELKKAEKNNQQYTELLKDYDSLQVQIKLTQENLTSLKNRVLQLEEWNRIMPALNERNLVKGELTKFEHLTFPVDGIHRLNQLDQLLIPIEGQIKALEGRLNNLQTDLDKERPNEQLIQKEAEIQEIVESVPLYDSLELQKSEWELKLSYLNEEIEELKTKLHIQTELEERITNSNTSIYMKEKTLEAQRKQHRLTEKKAELDEQFSKEKDTLERIEENINHLKQQLLPKTEREKLMERVSNSQNQMVIKKELENIADKIQFLGDAKQKEKNQADKNKKQGRFQTVLLAIIFAALTVWGLVYSQWLFSGAGAVGMLVVLLLLKRKDKVDDGLYKNELQALLIEEDKLEKRLRESNGSEIIFFEQQLDKDRALQEELQKITLKWDQQHDQYEKVIISFEKWEKDHVEHQELLSSLGAELKLPLGNSLNQIHDSFLLIERLKKQLREKQHIEIQLKSLFEKMSLIEKNIYQLANEFLDGTASMKESTVLLKKKLKAEIENGIKFTEKLAQLEQIENQLSGYKVECNHLEKEKNKLFELANVVDEEQFRVVGQAAEKRKRLYERVEQLDSQIQQSFLTEEIQRELSVIQNVVEEIHMTKEQISDSENELPLLLDRAAEIKYQIALLEDGGTYADLFHRFSQLKTEFELEAKYWARLALAKDILNKTVIKFKNERLPMLLEKAEEFLGFLTNGEYIRILPNEESNGFLIQRKDSILFSANELSQATTEQVYVSLRLALAVTIYKKYQLPIIIDDSFVNFDYQRTEKIVSLLRTFRENQILFFTCHKHLLDLFEENEVIMLNEKILAPIQ